MSAAIREAVPRRVTLHPGELILPFFDYVLISVPSFLFLCPFERNLYILDIYSSSDRNEIFRPLSFLTFSSDFLGHSTLKIEPRKRFGGQFCHLCPLMPLITKRNFWFLTKYFPCIINYSVQLDMGICFLSLVSLSE